MTTLAASTPRDGWSRPLDRSDVEMALQAAADCCILSNCRTLGNVTERHRMACESRQTRIDAPPVPGQMVRAWSGKIV
jgi:hypothetical protein